MSKKQSRPCAVCSRAMRIHRGKRNTCSPRCTRELSLLLAKPKARPHG